MAVNINDVAKRAGVSITTVSYVITGKRYVSEQLVEKVNQAMDELGYRPNVLARGLRGGKTNSIGLIIPDSSNMFFAEISKKIEDIGFKKGYSVILGNSDNDCKKEAAYIETLLMKQVDGVIFISSCEEPNNLLPLLENNIPVVVADRDVPFESVDVVMLDNEQAGYTATNYLIEQGHTSIGIITGPHDVNASAYRVEGYKRALADNGLSFDPNLVEVGGFTVDSGAAALKRMFTKPVRPTALFILNDMMAIGAIAASREIGISVPNDLSIVGFDNISLASVFSPSLTTMAQPFEEMARCATELLINRIKGKREDKNKHILLSANLEIRESVARRNK